MDKENCSEDQLKEKFIISLEGDADVFVDPNKYPLRTYVVQKEAPSVAIGAGRLSLRLHNARVNGSKEEADAAIKDAEKLLDRMEKLGKVLRRTIYSNSYGNGNGNGHEKKADVSKKGVIY